MCNSIVVSHQDASNENTQHTVKPVQKGHSKIDKTKVFIK